MTGVSRKWIVFCLVVLFPVISHSRNSIIIDKNSFTLEVHDCNDNIIYSCPIAYGKYKGDKEKEGDCKTPEGSFRIQAILDSSKWKHDFNDGNGIINDAYGPYFIRIHVAGFSGIGIHGTCFPESIGTRCTEGCIRVRNEDIITIVTLIEKGDVVMIKPTVDDTALL